MDLQLYFTVEYLLAILAGIAIEEERAAKVRQYFLKK